MEEMEKDLICAMPTVGASSCLLGLYVSDGVIRASPSSIPPFRSSRGGDEGRSRQSVCARQPIKQGKSIGSSLEPRQEQQWRY